MNLTTGMAVLLLAATTGSLTSDQLPAATGPDPADSVARAPGDTLALRRLLDSRVPDAMRQADIPGAAVAVVYRGTVVALAGYGLADIAQGIPVDPERTVFRVGSIAKPVTASVILSLIEDVGFDLDRDVRPLLTGLDLRPDYPPPLTLRQLLTHTAGFNEHLFGQHVRRPDDWLPLERYLERHLPPRFAPPGQVIAYTDFHTALAGVVAGRLAGRPFEQLAEERLFGPLGMSRSSYRQVDLPPALVGSLATSYTRQGDRLSPYARDYIQTTPAAGLQTTAGDMARYLIALLDEGRSDRGDPRAMTADSWRIQKTIHHRHHPKLDGKALGLTEVRHRGRSLLYKNGQASGFYARLVLVPEERLGVFLVHNRSILGRMGAFNAAARMPADILWDIIDAMVPPMAMAPLPPPVPVADSRERLAGFEGVYRTTVASRNTAEKLLALTDEIEVRRGPGDSLIVGDGPMVEVEPGLFQWSTGARYWVAFAPAVAGRSPYLFVGAGAYERIPWYESARSTTSIAIACIVVFLASCLFLGWRFRRLSVAPPPRSAKRLMGSAIAVGGLNLTFLALFGATLATTDVQSLFQGWPWTIRLALALPVGAVAPLLLLGRQLANGAVRADAGRLNTWSSALAFIGGGAFLWWLNTWNLLGWRL